MKRIKNLKTIVTLCVCLFTIVSLGTGCASKKSKGIEVKKEQITEDSQTTENVGKLDLSKLQDGNKQKDGRNSGNQQASQGAVQSDGQGTTGAGQNSAGSTDGAAQTQTEIVVYVCGAVNNPGVYTLSGTPRMQDAVEAAGGMNEQADRNVLNLAQYISDGQMIRIPAIGEVTDTGDWLEQQSFGSNEDNSPDSSSGNNSSTSQSNSNSGQTDNKVNLNSADVTELMTIPGVGQTKAEAIIRYREENGRFEEVEDIMQVSGIKEGSFAKMKPYICVSE